MQKIKVNLSFNKEYCWTLMEIVADESYNVPLKQAALIQLKNNIRLKWKNRNA